jgi:hypothetical protein
MGFIRICTGLLVLYTHLAYSLDLQAFFGKHGWYSLDKIERERRENPHFVSAFWDWDEPFSFPRLSDFPHRREAFMQFLKQTYLSDPNDPGRVPDAASAIAYLTRVNRMESQADALAALIYVEDMSNPLVRERRMKVLVGGKVEEPVIGPDPKKADAKKTDISASYQPPDVFAGLSAAEKAEIAAEIQAFLVALDRVKWRDPVSGRNYVFAHLREIPPDGRRALLNYMHSLTLEDVAKREELLRYLEYWNNDPRTTYRTGYSTFSFWFHITDPTQMAVMHGLVLVLIFLFTIGLFTRVTSVLVWVAVISYIHRTQQVLFGMDTMMNILLFYLMIGNCGAALSVDRLIARYRAARASIARCGRIDANTRAFLACPPPSVSAGFGQRLIQVHFCFIYMAAGLAKLKGVTWWDGRAFWEVLVNPEFTLLHYQWYEDTVRWIAGIKPLYNLMLAGGVWFTLFVEIAMPFLVWTRLRWVMIFLATLMHAIIAVLMGLNLFELLMVVMLLAYLPDRVVRDRFRGGPELPKFAFSFNPASATQTKAAALAVALDVDNQIALKPDDRAAEPAVAAVGGAPTRGAEGAGVLYRGLRLFTSLWLLLWVPGVRFLLSRRLFPTATDPRATPSVKPPATAAR